MIRFKVDNVDVMIEDLGEGKGKILISDLNYGYNFSNYWGAMGDSIFDFLIRINADYFADKLGPYGAGEINTRKTMALVRKSLKEYFYSEFPWYVEKEIQQDLRDELKVMATDGFVSDDHFVSVIDRLEDNLNYYLIDNTYDRARAKEAIKASFSEPWYCIYHDEHKQITYLKKFHTKLVKKLKKLDLTKTETVKEF